MAIDIRHRWSGRVAFTHAADGATMAQALAAARARDADLNGVDLSGADLSGADLRDTWLSHANLSRADLSDADLSGAHLTDANLVGAKLSGAKLRGAFLYDANLLGADLRGADLSNASLRGTNLNEVKLLGAELSGADLRRAALRGADLRGANLLPIRDDLWAVLSSAPREVPALLAALKAGRVDGSTEGACLIGIIAAARQVSVDELGSLTRSDLRPAERFFTGICLGDTPETNQFSALALEWASEWLDTMRAAFAPAA